MPFKPLSNALLNPYKAPFKNCLYNYLITKNLRRFLINSFLTHFPTFPLHFCQYISRGDGWWVLMVSIKFIVNPHIIITQHSISHIINTQHSLPNTHPPTFNPSYHQHSTFITHPPTFNPSYHQHSTFITQHPTFNTHHPTFNPTHHQHPTFNTHHPTFNTHHPTFNPTHHQHPTPNTHHPSFPTPLIS